MESQNVAGNILQIPASWPLCLLTSPQSNEPQTTVADYSQKIVNKIL